jgi:ABC-2 type transport system ATP-binding protein
VSRVLESVGLAERADDPLSELSSGLRRRAELAAALIHEPLLLLLDEPFSNLDPEGVEMLGSIVENQKLRGMALVATSDPAEARIGEQCLDLRRMHEER